MSIQGTPGTPENMRQQIKMVPRFLSLKSNHTLCWIYMEYFFLWCTTDLSDRDANVCLKRTRVWYRHRYSSSAVWEGRSNWIYRVVSVPLSLSRKHRNFIDISCLFAPGTIYWLIFIDRIIWGTTTSLLFCLFHLNPFQLIGTLANFHQVEALMENSKMNH